MHLLMIKQGKMCYSFYYSTPNIFVQLSPDPRPEQSTKLVETNDFLTRQFQDPYQTPLRVFYRLLCRENSYNVLIKGRWHGRGVPFVKTVWQLCGVLGSTTLQFAFCNTITTGWGRLRWIIPATIDGSSSRQPVKAAPIYSSFHASINSHTRS